MFSNLEQEYFQIEQNMFIFKTYVLIDIKLPHFLLMIKEVKQV